MNFRKLLIFPLLILAVVAVAADAGGRKKPKKKKKKKNPRTEKVASFQTRTLPEALPKETYRYSGDADPFAPRRSPWTDSVMSSLSPRERIGQLFMVAAYSNRDEKHYRQIDSLVAVYGIGGLIFMQGGPVRQANLTNRWQSIARVPLMLSMDAEWGLAMRLDSVSRFPKQMTLGALPSDTLVYQMGREIALQCQRIGMQVNFAPVADVNNNPANPVINMRSFGEGKELVTRRAIAYMRGMQDQHVLATGKHFPGHGDTDADSHHALPVIRGDRDRLDSLELYPFRKLFEAGLGSVMVAHLYVPALDTAANVATTLSPKVVTGLLRNELNYKGLVFTDALNMKGVAGYYMPGAVDVKALLAGNDMLLFSEDVPTAMNLIDSALVKGEITQAEIDVHCRKILQAKEWSGLNRLTKVSLNNLVSDLNPSSSEVLIRQ
ncbi:MAG: glycoside hydrolase family 3 N-terminal domain-containing protein, partial [Bacteroidota bacterium]